MSSSVPISQLKDIPNVSQAAPTDGWVLTWVASTSKWTPSATAAISLTGTPAAPTAAPGTNTTQIATTAFVTTADNLKAPIASPVFTGPVSVANAAALQGRNVGNSAYLPIAQVDTNDRVILSSFGVLTSVAGNLLVGSPINVAVVGGSNAFMQTGTRTITQEVAGDQSTFACNVYFSGAAWKYITSSTASAIRMHTGGIGFYTIPSGAAGTSVSNMDTSCHKLWMDANGRLLLGEVMTAGSANAWLEVKTPDGSTNIAALYDSGGNVKVTVGPSGVTTFVGSVSGPTASAGTNTTQLATTAFVTAGLGLKAPIASPSLTGTLSVVTAGTYVITVGTAAGYDAYPGVWFGVTPTIGNFAFLADVGGGQTILNGPAAVSLRIGNSTKANFLTSSIFFYMPTIVGAAAGSVGAMFEVKAPDGSTPIAAFYDSAGVAKVTVGTAGATTFASSVAIGGGTAVTKVLHSSATLDFGSTAAQSSADLTISVTGAAVGDGVFLSLPAAPAANTSFMGWVSAADTVTVRHNNYSSAAVDPASGSYRAWVFKP